MIEHRGVQCIACLHLDLQSHPTQAKNGWGVCRIAPDTTFVRFQQSRNCKDYEPAAEEAVKVREDWAKKIPLPAWQR